MFSRALRGLAAACVPIALVGCSTTRGDETSGGFISGDGTITTVEPAEREPAPELSGVDLDGNELSTADYEGETLVVNVWGAWCGPCRSETPDLIAAAKELESEDVQFLGLTTKGKLADDKRFADKMKVPYPSIQDYDGRQQLGFVDSLPARSIPTTWVIDSEGRVAARIMGEATRSTLVGLVEEVQTS